MKDTENIYDWGRILVERRYRLIRHLLLMSLIGFLAFQNVYGSFHKEGFLYAYMVSVFIFAFPIYINIYRLIPRFLDKRRFMSYWASFMGIIVFSALLGLVCFYPLHRQYGINEFSLQDGQTFSFLSIIHSMLVLTLISGSSTSFEMFRRWMVSGRKISELENTTMQTELQQLKNQINPHFLFNMLNNVYVLIKKGRNEAAEVLFKLEDLLRYQLNDSSQEKIQLNSDIHFMNDFLNLEKIRRDNFNYIISKEGDINKVWLPPLLFIPFVENAVKHNTDSENASFVHLSFIVQDNRLLFRCENSIPLPEEEVKEPRIGGLGLKNIKRRLELLYPGRHSLEIIEMKQSYTVNLQLEL